MGTKMSYGISVVGLLAGLSVACGKAESPPTQRQGEVSVIYADFEVDPIAGYHENEIERVGCRYRMSATDFDSLIIRRVSREEYSGLDIKAKVIKDNLEVMYIDDSGVMRSSSGFFQIDTKKFEQLIIPAKACDVEPPSP
jgi:hypothetical protein